MTADTTHLVALMTRLSHEREYLAAEKTEGGKALRKVWIMQIEKEIEAEYKFLGMVPDSELPELTDDELLEMLG